MSSTILNPVLISDSRLKFKIGFRRDLIKHSPGIESALSYLENSTHGKEGKNKMMISVHDEDQSHHKTSPRSIRIGTKIIDCSRSMFKECRSRQRQIKRKKNASRGTNYKRRQNKRNTGIERMLDQENPRIKINNLAVETTKKKRQSIELALPVLDSACYA